MITSISSVASTFTLLHPHDAAYQARNSANIQIERAQVRGELSSLRVPCENRDSVVYV